MRRLLPALLLAPALAGCPGDDGPDEPDASCALGVLVGSGTPSSFTPVADGDPAEVVLGFQGFRMLVFTLRLEGAPDDLADVSGYVSIDDGAIEVSQLPRTVRLREGPDGAAYAEEFLIFFNETPVSEIVDRPAELELVARSGGCVGGMRVGLELRDDDDCVDYGVEIDAGTLDGGVPDGAVACEEGP